MDQTTDHLLLENFNKDRNVILKIAQKNTTQKLLNYLINLTVKKYGVLFNPLGIVDDTFGKILNYKFDNCNQLIGIYENLSVGYRYKNSDNQLEIIWDGRTHETVYTEKWEKKFKTWIDDLTQNPTFTKGIIQLTVFHDNSQNNFFIENSLKAVINEYFAIKILKKNGHKRVYLPSVPNLIAS